MRIDYEVKVSGDLNPNDIAKICKKELQKIGYKIERTSKELVPTDTGDLKNSITPKMNGNFEVEVGSNVEYALWIEDGTSPHGIDGNPILHFTAKDGSEVFTTHVNHPGNKDYLYLEKSLETHIDEFVENLERALGDAL